LVFFKSAQWLGFYRGAFIMVRPYGAKVIEYSTIKKKEKWNMDVLN
jgi:hypothetical protein